MKALPVIFVQPTCPGDQRAKGIQFLSTCNLCRESRKTQVWLCFLILSFLSTSMCAAPVLYNPGDAKVCLQKLEEDIKNSDAMLYAPSAHEVKENCKMMSLRCYMLELLMVADEMMVTDEEEIQNNFTSCIFFFTEKLPKAEPVGCPPCEAYSLKNITIFLERLNTLLEEMTEREKLHNT